jgi:hypothetical protein
VLSPTNDALVLLRISIDKLNNSIQGLLEHINVPLTADKFSQLESATADQSVPAVLDVLKQQLGLSTSSDVQSLISEVSSRGVSHRRIVHKLVSLIVYNLVFKEDPFSNYSPSKRTRRVLEQLYSKFLIVVTNLSNILNSGFRS